jgi:hypothetical protein
MGISLGLTIAGIQDAQAENLRMIAALRPDGALGEAVQSVTIGLHRYLVVIRHVDTGTLRAAEQMEISESGLRGRVFTDPGAINPRSHRAAVDYEVFEEARGGTHAAWERTVVERAPQLEGPALQIVVREMFG